MYVNFIFEIDKKLDYRKIFIFFEVALMWVLYHFQILELQSVDHCRVIMTQVQHFGFTDSQVKS